MADRELGSIPGEAELRLISATDNRAWEAKVSPALPRADVQKLLGGNVAYANPGYSVTLDVSGLPSGRYRLYTVFPSSDELRACDNGRVISITN